MRHAISNPFERTTRILVPIPIASTMLSLRANANGERIEKMREKKTKLDEWMPLCMSRANVFFRHTREIDLANNKFYSCVYFAFLFAFRISAVQLRGITEIEFQRNRWPLRSASLLNLESLFAAVQLADRKEKTERKILGKAARMQKCLCCLDRSAILKRIQEKLIAEIFLSSV